jgi:hypothetical protein
MRTQGIDPGIRTDVEKDATPAHEVCQRTELTVIQELRHQDETLLG